MWWHTRRNQILSFGETDESISIGGGSVNLTTGRRAVHISLQGLYCSCKPVFCIHVTLTGSPLHSLVSPSLLPCVTVCHHISTGLYHNKAHVREMFETSVQFQWLRQFQYNWHTFTTNILLSTLLSVCWAQPLMYPSVADPAPTYGLYSYTLVASRCLAI